PRGPRPDLGMSLVGVTIDYRPGGRVLQGPPMTAVIAEAPAENPYASTRLSEGRWVDAASAEPEVVCTRNTLRRFGRGECAALGETVKFVGREGTMSAKLVGYLDEVKLPRGFPDTFANGAAFSLLAAEQHGSIALWKTPVDVPDVLTPRSEGVVAGFRNDEQRRMDYARPLMLVASVLTALALLVNSLLLSVEANRSQLAVLRTIGLTRLGVVAFVAAESVISALAGLAVGVAASMLSLKAYVAADPVAFPTGAAFDLKVTALAAALALAVALLAVLFALKPALSVRPMDAAASLPRPRRRGMAVAFAFGFGAFVAVEVWGASLMRGFVPSAEWPDAIVSLLPAGASSFDVEKLRGLEGVRRVSELYPLQLNFAGEKPQPEPQGRGGRPKFPANALFLAAEWLPDFRFVEGSRDECAKALAEGDACVISLMISNARNLHRGDRLAVLVGGGRSGPATEVSLPIAGVVDVNWHMVTSRGLVRGMNGAPGMTDGPVFVSLDTIESLDVRPAMMVRMTPLWVEYEPDFLASNGVFQAGRIVEREIADALGNPVELTVRLHARDEIADGTLAHGTDVIGQAARVPFVFLAILAIGFVAMLVAEADARRREHAVLRAVGATRAQLAARLAASALKTALAGIVAGLPAGALAGWLFAIKTASMWKGMPHYFAMPWSVVAEGAVCAVVFALVFAVPTSLALVSPRRR
ncbi:MAG: ABC transporter permease, partial [Kiritimatiellae bacterium]|nr:ABC transporter permease [Kiritimatiellia bacterium]